MSTCASFVKTWIVRSCKFKANFLIFGCLYTDFLIDGRRIGLFRGARITTGWLELGTQITPRGWIFWTMIFYNLKNSGQDLSNEGSNFILSSLEDGSWVAQT